MPIVKLNSNTCGELTKSRDGEIHGVVGSFSGVYTDSGNRIKKQVFITDWRNYSEEKNCKIRVEIRFDDRCGNKCENFAITGEVRQRGRDYMVGCIQDGTEKYFPELAHLIKWHHMSVDGPLHYIANTLYHAKNNNLTAAKSCAIWPDATDEQLCSSDNLEKMLIDRLPGLKWAFKNDVLACGLIYPVRD